MAATSPQDNVSPDCAASGTPQAQTQALADPFLLTLVTREERELFEQYFLKVRTGNEVGITPQTNRLVDKEGCAKPAWGPSYAVSHAQVARTLERQRG